MNLSIVKKLKGLKCLQHFLQNKIYFIWVIRLYYTSCGFKIDRTNFRLKKLLYHKNCKITFKKIIFYITL